MLTHEKGRETSKSKFDFRAQEDYDNLFYELESDSEEGADQQDFCRPLQHSDLLNQPSKPNSKSLEETSSLEGTEGINLPLGAEITSDSNSSDTSSFRVNLALEPSFSSRDLSMTPKIPLNQKMSCSRNSQGPSLNLQ